MAMHQISRSKKRIDLYKIDQHVWSDEFIWVGLKWIDDFDIPKQLAVLEIFRRQITAAGCLDGGYNQGIPPGEAVMVL
jgi:hypothetical protein